MTTREELRALVAEKVMGTNVEEAICLAALRALGVEVE